MEDDAHKKHSSFDSIVDVIASTRTAIVLLVLITAASMVGTAMADQKAWQYIYGHAWFHGLLGLLGVNLLACMMWRKRISRARAWSLVTHLGIVLVLLGALVTLVTGERGSIRLSDGQQASSFIPEGAPAGSESRSLGFDLRLVDFRLVHYPPVNYAYLMRQGAKPIRVRVELDRDIVFPGTTYRLTNVRPLTQDPAGAVAIVFTDGRTQQVSAKLGTTPQLDQEGLSLEILRYEPAFKIDRATHEVSSDTDEPINPALQVVLITDGKKGNPQWLFAAHPDFGGTGPHSSGQGDARLRYLHPSLPTLLADAATPHGTHTVRLNNREPVPSPWDPMARLAYEHGVKRVKEYESEVEVLEEGNVVRRHIIRVNAPLVHRGTKFSQHGYDSTGLRWTQLGVSRDSGVWFVYAGFIATMLGLVGRFYVSPAIRQMRSGSATEGDHDGLA